MAKLTTGLQFSHILGSPGGRTGITLGGDSAPVQPFGLARGEATKLRNHLALSLEAMQPQSFEA